MIFKATSNGDDELQLAKQLQAFADGYWLPGHATDDQAAEIILDAFKRKMAGQLELLYLTYHSKAEE